MGIPVRGMHFPAWRKLNHMFTIPGALVRLMAILRSCQPSLVHVNDYWWGPLCSLACRLAGINVPILVHIRQEIQEKRIRQYWLKKFDKLLAVSMNIKTVLVRGGLPSETIDVLYSGVYWDDGSLRAAPSLVRNDYGLRPNQPVIGTIANIFPRKGHEFLIHAMEHLQSVFPDIHCFLVGKGDKGYLLKLQRLVQAKHLERHITFAGFQENVAGFLEAFDVFVLPSRLEGLPLALLEAMAMKKPVVATQTGGIPEAVEAGVTGYLVPSENSRELALAVQDLLKDPDARSRMGEAGKQRVERLFTKQRMMKQLEDVYQQFA